MQINLATLRQQELNFINSIQKKNYRDGKSIVTTSYHKEVPSTWVLLNELSRVGCDLPVEIFYRDGELNEQEIELLSSVSDTVQVKKINGSPKDYISIYGHKHGWSCKIYAILESEYKENLWLDADCYPIIDPSFLFKDQEYLQKGSLFWRDVFSPDSANQYCDTSVMWPIFNINPNDSEPFEAGQLLINKDMCWRQVSLIQYYADNCEIYYGFGGDKETFKFAWQIIGMIDGHSPLRINYHSDPNVPFGFMPYGPFHKGRPNQYGKWAGGTVMVQRDRSGKELFNHRNMDKFVLGENIFNDDIINEDHYHNHIQKLRTIL